MNIDELQRAGEELIQRSKETARRFCTFDSDWTTSDHRDLVAFVRRALRAVRRVSPASSATAEQPLSRDGAR
ncbi:MAG: hypothetical protein Q8S13_03760 [Dehalococcoidia bacterium]|nr:hypothetical protein [Dehalococcoidia bacterium]